MQMIHDLEYMNWVMMETLRMQPPAPNTTSLILSKDAKVGDLYLKKGDEFMVNFNALSYNAN
jgi:cytochrome P450